MKTSMKKRDVLLLNRLRPSLKTRFFVFKFKTNNLGLSRVAFIFPRKCGNAVKRNRFKRRMRAFFSYHLKGVDARDVLCIARGSLKAISDNSWHYERKKMRVWCEGVQNI